MKTLAACLLISITCTIAALAQSTTTTDVQHDLQGRVSSITTTIERGTERTDHLYTGASTRETTHEATTFELVQRGYQPLGRSGHHPLGR